LVSVRGVRWESFSWGGRSVRERDNFWD
jgi:hypothetical protein